MMVGVVLEERDHHPSVLIHDDWLLMRSVPKLKRNPLPLPPPISEHLNRLRTVIPITEQMISVHHEEEETIHGDILDRREETSHQQVIIGKDGRLNVRAVILKRNSETVAEMHVISRVVIEIHVAVMIGHKDAVPVGKGMIEIVAAIDEMVKDRTVTVVGVLEEQKEELPTNQREMYAITTIIVDLLLVTSTETKGINMSSSEMNDLLIVMHPTTTILLDVNVILLILITILLEMLLKISDQPTLLMVLMIAAHYHKIGNHLMIDSYHKTDNHRKVDSCLKIASKCKVGNHLQNECPRKIASNHLVQDIATPIVNHYAKMTHFETAIYHQCAMLDPSTNNNNPVHKIIMIVVQ